MSFIGLVIRETKGAFRLGAVCSQPDFSLGSIAPVFLGGRKAFFVVMRRSTRVGGECGQRLSYVAGFGTVNRKGGRGGLPRQVGKGMTMRVVETRARVWESNVLCPGALRLMRARWSMAPDWIDGWITFI